MYGVNIRLPEELEPDNIDMRAEIWRYKKDGSEGTRWTRVFKAPEGVLGFRFMICYTSPETKETAIYAGAFTTTPELAIFKSTDGVNWKKLDDNIPGNSTRAMVIHKGYLYMAALDETSDVPSAKIYASTDPERNGWELVTPPGSDSSKNPTQEVVTMASFNGHLYAATGGSEGFELWRTLGNRPEPDKWKLVIDKGAGDATNIAPLTLGTFKNHLYVGAIMFPLSTRLRPEAFKPFDLIRINTQDRWELVIGGNAIEPTNPTTGKRGKALSNLPSGAGSPTNLYCWQLREFNGRFYLGTFDWLVLLLPLLRANLPAILSRPDLIKSEAFIRFMLDLVKLLSDLDIDKKKVVKGFDMYSSRDGIHWRKITLNGLGNPHNYGLRNLFVSENGRLYLGTANPFDGCEVWESTFVSYDSLKDNYTQHNNCDDNISINLKNSIKHFKIELSDNIELMGKRDE